MELGGSLVEDDSEIAALLASTRSIAVIGIKPDNRTMEPAHYVPRYMQDEGYRIIPVPVYYPEVTEILAQPVVRSLDEIESDVDMVNVFRRSEDVPKHVNEIIRKRPRSVWLQLGIVNDEAAAMLVDAGIKVVQNRCLLVEHRALAR